MKKFLYITLAAAIALISCNKSEFDGGEMVTLDYKVGMLYAATKAATLGDGSHVDRVVCAVFENGKEITALRETFARNADGTFPNFQPSLYLGKEYQVVFWAHKDGKYNVTEMDNITYSDSGYQTNDELMDAFTLTQTVRINKDRSVTVGAGEDVKTVEPGKPMLAVLKRPFSKLNIGTLAADWVDGAITHSRITLSVMQTHFNAVSGNVVEDQVAEDQTFTAPVVEQTFTAKIDVEGEYKYVDYRYVSLNYLFPGAVANVTIEVAKDADADGEIDQEEIICVVTKENVPVGANQQINMIGNVLKGDLSFNVSVDGAFDPDNQTNIGF